jgi:fatty acid desaturase
MIVRFVGYLAILFWLLPPGIAVAFVGVQIGVFGFLLGGAFAPNHIAMPLVPREVKVDFLRRQVLMSRNIKGGPVVRFLMGGLDLQVEHHLFPGMARPNLRQASKLVRRYCAEHRITYTETTLIQSYGQILRYLDAVGLSARRGTFVCPMVAELRL